MATRTWISSSSTDWNVIGNWSGGAVPGNGDDVVFDGSSQMPVLSWPAAVALASLTITNGYTGYIGTESSALTINVNATAASLLSVAGRGKWYKFNGSMRNARSTLVGSQLLGIAGGTWGASGGTTGQCIFNGGKITIDAGADIDFARIGGGAEVDIGALSAAIDSLVLDGVTARVSASLTLLVQVNQGLCQLLSASAITTGYIAGKLLDHSSANHTALSLMSGSLYTPEGSRYSSKTITTVYKMPGARFVKQVAGFAVTATNEFGEDAAA